MWWQMIAVVAYIALLLHSRLCKGGIECLSDIAYDRHRCVFPTLMTVMAVALFCSIVSFVAFVGCAALIGIGMTPYKEERYSEVHRWCALTAMGCVFWLWAGVGYWYMPLLFMLGSMRKRWLLGVEMGMMAAAISYIVLGI